MKRFLTTLLVAGSLFCAGTANAQTIFADNFDADGPLNLNFTNFINWDVSDGTVDLIGQTFFNLYPGFGNFVDMDGSSGNAGTLTTKTTFNLDPGDYVFRFLLGKNGNDREIMDVTIGSAFSETFDHTGSIPTYLSIERNFTLAAPVSASIAFAQQGGDNAGFVLDGVELIRLRGNAAAPEPGTLALLTVFGGVAVGFRRRR
jgi:hypothetical protein